jgi:hypothetical protein
MDYDSLVESLRTIQEAPAQAGIVLSRKAWADLKRNSVNPSVGTQAKVNEPMPLMDTPLYPFPDVPDTKVWLFKDREVLIRYLKLREEIGHKAAIQRISADVEDELIIEAEIRALTDRS